MTATVALPTVIGAHLVGSVNLPEADDVFRAAAGALGDRLPRIPDGEVGERFYWLQFQTSRFDRTPGLARVGDDPGFRIRDRFDPRPFTLDGSVAAEDVRFVDLGYAAAAIESWTRFRALQDDGVIPASTRFQVSLPTPAAVVGVFFAPPVRAAIEPVYSAALYAELDRILAVVPHERLAVQWDTAVEFAWLERAEIGGETITPWWDDVLAGVLDRVEQEAAHVPEPVQLGFHLCYGDVEEEHFVQPADAGLLASVVRGVLSRSPRPVDWVHLPVPIERDDAAYFAPLADLPLPERTQLFLGLVHHEDGLEGAERRVAAAATALTRFGVATECGLGRGPEERMRPVLDLHRAVVDAHRGA